MKTLSTIAFLFVSMAAFMSFRSNESEMDKEGINALKKCSALYLQLKTFSVDMEYSIFYNSTDFTRPDEIERGLIKRKNQLFYQEQFGQIMLLNSDYMMSVNNNSRIISLNNRSEKDQIPAQINLDSLGKSIDRVEKMKDGYRYFLNTPELEKMDVFFSKDGYLLKMRNYYRNKVNFGEGDVSIVVQIQYLNFDQNPKFDSNTFSEKKYLQIQKAGHVTPVTKYKNYEVLNNLEYN